MTQDEMLDRALTLHLQKELMVLSIKPPYPDLMMDGKKTIENRSLKPADCRIGEPMLIHASSQRHPAARNLKGYDNACRSAVVGVAHLVDVIRPRQRISEKLKSKYRLLGVPDLLDGEKDSVYWWIFGNATAFEKPITCHGKLNLWYPWRVDGLQAKVTNRLTRLSHVLSFS